MWKTILGLALAAGVAAPAGAFETIIGGPGLAHECSVAAFSGQVNPKFERVCTEALEREALSPHDESSTYVNRGILRMRRLDYAAAVGDFDHALGIRPEMGVAFVNRGAARIGQHRYREGLDDINKALELGVKEPEKAYFNRALAYEGLDDMKAAFFDYQKALELKPDWEPPRRELQRFTVSSP